MVQQIEVQTLHMRTLATMHFCVTYWARSLDGMLNHVNVKFIGSNNHTFKLVYIECAIPPLDQMVDNKYWLCVCVCVHSIWGFRSINGLIARLIIANIKKHNNHAIERISAFIHDTK